MNIQKDPYVYLKCKYCDCIFRLVKSSYEIKGLPIIECPHCHICTTVDDYKKVSRVVWKRSNEVISNV